MSSDSNRAALTRDQLSAYFDRIKLPSQHRNYHVADLKPEDALAHLHSLLKHQLAEIPFENLTLHYSHHRQISIHPEELFKKIVSDNNGRGGYCMENNTLFGALLHSVGFDVFSAGARVFDDGRWSGW